jgi:periplasmic divalent cation tolerance protein
LTDVRVVLVTAADRDTGLNLVRQVVEERLAACGNVLPGVTSVFEWEGTMREQEEVLLIFKTVAAQTERLAERIAELHTYDVPEVLTLAVDGGHNPFLDWVREFTHAESSDGQKRL